MERTEIELKHGGVEWDDTIAARENRSVDVLGGEIRDNDWERVFVRRECWAVRMSVHCEALPAKRNRQIDQIREEDPSAMRGVCEQGRQRCAVGEVASERAPPGVTDGNGEVLRLHRKFLQNLLGKYRLFRRVGRHRP